MLPRLSILALPLTALGAAAPRSAEAPRPGEYEVKAALLFNVLKFVEWPAPPPGALVVCVFKEERMAEALESLGDKIVAGARLQVRRVESAEDTRACRALFIGRSEESRLGDILKATAGLDLLTVADTQGFGERGVVVYFFVEDGHVPPAQVGGHPQHRLAGLDQPGNGHREAGDVGPGGAGGVHRPGHRQGRQVEDLTDRTPPEVAGQDRALAHRAGQVHGAGGEVVDVDLEADPDRTGRREPERGRRPAARTRGRRAVQLGHQPGSDQRVDQAGHGGFGKTGCGGDPGA